jgi:hypothetical protein
MPGSASVSVLERSSEWNNWNYWNGWNHWNRLLLDVFKAMEGLNPQVKRKILSDNPSRFYRISSILVCPKDFIFFGIG